MVVVRTAAPGIGRRANITVSKTNFQPNLEEHLRFETLLADVSARFVGLPSEALDQEIEDAQRRICETLGLDRSTLTQFDGPNDEARITHSWAIPGHKPSPITPIEQMFPWTLQRIRSGQNIQFTSLDELPSEAATDCESFRRIAQKSNATFPLMVGGKVLGSLSFGALKAERRWPEALVKRLQLVTQIFANALARKRADRALRESEERFRLLIEQAPEAIVVMDVEQNRLVQANAQAERLFGCSRQELLESGPQRFYTAEQPDGQPIAESMRAHSGRTLCGETVVFERSIRNAFGQRFHCEVRLVRLPAGERKLVRASFVDVTERKRAEEALRTSEGRLQVVADLAGLGCYELDYTASSSFADDRFGELCGMPSGQQTGLQRMQFWIEHLHLDDRERVLEERQKMYEGKIERYDVEYRYLHPVQGQKWIHHLGRVAARDANGRAIHLYGVVQDITERKQADEELQRLRLHLWHADRVAQTGAVTASLAHELNQPLTAILSNAQAGLRFMDGGNPNLGEIREILADIAHDDKRAGAVISGLRNMLRRKETQRERINLAHTIEEVLALVHSELVGQQIELRLRLEPASMVLADKGQLQQVILNLVMNAVQAMQDRPARQRRLELTSTRTNEGEAKVSVRDSGPGIPQEQQGKLFEGFWTTKHEGLGIGLPISRSIVESHGGRLSFTNNPDQGATFSFTLPLATNPDSFRTVPRSAAGPGAT